MYMYRIAGYFWGTQFSRITQTKHFADFNLEDIEVQMTTPLQ